MLAAVTNSAVPVTNGLFTVTLDFGPTAFDGNARWLDIGVRTNGSATDYTPLAPRQPVTPTPYAIHAGNAEMLAGAGATNYAPATGSAEYVSKRGDTMTGGLNVSAGNVGIGTTTPTAKLEVQTSTGSVLLGTDKTEPAELLYIHGGRSSSSTAAAVIEGDYGAASELILKAGDAHNNRRAGIRFFNYQISSSTPLWLLGSSFEQVPGDSGFYLQSSSLAPVLTALQSGSVGIGTTRPQARLDVAGEVRCTLLKSGGAQIDASDGNHFLFTQGGAASWNGGAYSDSTFRINESGAGARLTIASGGNVGIGTTTPQALLDVNGNAIVRGNLGIGRTSPETALHIEGPGNSGRIRINNLMPGKASLVLQDNGVQTGIFGLSGGVEGDSTADTSIFAETGHGLRFYSGGTATERMVIDASGNVGIGTTSPQAKLHVSGEILTKAVNITAGADIAEPFPVAGPDIPKGAVVVIDDTQPGQLKLSERAYDTRVAGIVSGAGGVNSGLTLRQEGALEGLPAAPAERSAAQAGNHNVALTGRVYALADANSSPIKPGDMLTTSDTPGHCMKATDRERRDGAILGKAMSPLESGQGLVLVLVTLQ